MRLQNKWGWHFRNINNMFCRVFRFSTLMDWLWAPSFPSAATTLRAPTASVTSSSSRLATPSRPSMLVPSSLPSSDSRLNIFSTNACISKLEISHKRDRKFWNLISQLTPIDQCNLSFWKTAVILYKILNVYLAMSPLFCRPPSSGPEKSWRTWQRTSIAALWRHTSWPTPRWTWRTAASRTSSARWYSKTNLPLVSVIFNSPQRSCWVVSFN